MGRSRGSCIGSCQSSPCSTIRRPLRAPTTRVRSLASSCRPSAPAGLRMSQTLDTQRLTSYFRRTIGHRTIANPRLRMTKADLVEHVTAQISKTAGPMISKKDCARVVDAFLDAIKDALKEQKNIEVRGFGTFKIRQRKTRMARNPRTGSPVEVSARPVPVFKPSKELRAMVAGMEVEDDEEDEEYSEA